MGEGDRSSRARLWVRGKGSEGRGRLIWGEGRSRARLCVRGGDVRGVGLGVNSVGAAL